MREFKARREGIKFFLFFHFIALAFFFFGNDYRAMGLVPMALAIFTIYFFRDPGREVDCSPGRVLSPADGKVTSIEDVTEETYVHGSCKRVSIFLSVMNVHINRSPIAGKIEHIKHTPGKFMNAMSEKSGMDNENNAIGINGDIKILVRQIAGLIARRIVCACDVGTDLRAGEKFGMIRFGSRTDLFLPSDTEIHVSVGDKVKAGLTLIGVYENEKTDAQV
ncbi:phosphatidylserine decarboxylase family protein [Candidatus Hydrogenedentota bacterium]